MSDLTIFEEYINDYGDRRLLEAVQAFRDALRLCGKVLQETRAAAEEVQTAVDDFYDALEAAWREVNEGNE